MIVGNKVQFAIGYKYTDSESVGNLTIWIGGIALNGDALDYVSYISEFWRVIMKPQEFVDFPHSNLQPIEILNNIVNNSSFEDSVDQKHVIKCTGGFDNYIIVSFIEYGVVNLVWANHFDSTASVIANANSAKISFADYRKTLLQFSDNLPSINFAIPT